MSELVHRVRVFVFRIQDRWPLYLLLRSAQGIEGFWTPIHGPIRFDEKLEGAIRREVAEDIGVTRFGELIDLRMPARWVLGDEEVIEWSYGIHADPTAGPLRLAGERWAEYLWAPFGRAFPALELEHDRAAILRLHATLGAA
ncbi:MAG: NUDIX domain-containing protein [Planctomycetota bacterium]